MKTGILAIAHLAAFFTIIVWGFTFISTKILLDTFSPLEILFLRFFVGWLALWLICPHILKFTGCKTELHFALAGLSGVTLYFLFENIALTRTSAANVGVIVTMAPFFTALLAWPFLHSQKPGANFFCGCALAFTGLCMLSFGGQTVEFNPFGDFLALMAAISWAVYSIFTRMLASRGYGVIKTTRRVFFYGLLFMLPCMAWDGFSLDPASLAAPQNWGNLLFLGLGASALCFATWTFTVKTLGAVSASVYIYLVPVVTILAAAVILHEKLTPLAIAGAALALAGLAAAEYQPGRASGQKTN